MCGTAGVIKLQKANVNHGLLTLMSDAIAHHGPDGESPWVNDSKNVELARWLLAVLYLSGCSAQPIHS